MTSNFSANNAEPSPSDDSYWAALFEQEESVVPEPPIEGEEEKWSTVQDRVDGRMQWADGGKPQQQNPWQLAQEHHEADETLELPVIGHNKGGLLVQWNNLQGFVPASQLVDFPQFHVERERIHAIKKWYDKKLQLKIIEVNATTTSKEI